MGEERYSVSDDYLDAVIDMLPVGILRFDSSSECAHANCHWCEMTGLTPVKALGNGWLLALREGDRARAREAASSAATVSGGQLPEFRYVSGAGEAAVMTLRTVPLGTASGIPCGRLLVCTDVTALRRAESESRLIADQLSERVKELNCLFEISAIVERSGGSVDRILRDTVELLPPTWGHPEDACARIVLNTDCFESDNYQDTPWKQASEIIVRGRQAGVVEVCYLKQMPARDEGPFVAEERKLINAIAVKLGRVVERLWAEQSLRDQEYQLRDRLTHLARVSTMGEMASSIAHEINQPLTAISTYAQACRRFIDSGGASDDSLQDALHRISDEAHRAGDIIHGLKRLIGRSDSRRTESDVNELIYAVRKLSDVDARQRDVRLRLVLSESLPTVVVDGVQIQQVILNLIRNAVDAMEHTEPEYREVVVRTVPRNEQEIEVSVCDSGSGLPEDVGEDLFEPFYTTKQDGLGMGLSISRSIVNTHGGRMWFKPNVDRGTTFFFTIPTTAARNDEAH
jgi:PAS domain S-box-containing protein